MSDIHLFEFARRVGDVHPFDVLRALVAHGQDPGGRLMVDEGLVPEARRWLEIEEWWSEPPAPGAAPESPPRDLAQVTARMLAKLKAKRKIGEAHTRIDNAYRGVPDHFKGAAKRVLLVLIREGYILSKPTANGIHISLMPERMPELEAMMAGRFDNPRVRAAATARC